MNGSAHTRRMADLQIILFTSLTFLVVDPRYGLGLDQRFGRLNSKPGGTKGVKSSVQKMASLAFGCNGLDIGDANVTCSNANLEKRFGEGLDCTSKVPVKTQVFFVNCPPGYALVEDYQVINCKFPGNWDNEMFTCDEVSTVATTPAKPTTKAVNLTAKLATKPPKTTPNAANITTTKTNNTIKASSTSLPATTLVSNITVATPTGVAPLSTTVAATNTSSTAATAAANTSSSLSSVASTTNTTLAAAVTTPTSITTTITTPTTTTPITTTSITADTTTTATTTTTSPTTTVDITTLTSTTTTAATTTTTTSQPPTSTTTLAATTTTTKPNNGYAYAFENSIYKIHRASMSWDEGELICISEEAHLIIIDKREEINYIQSIHGSRPFFVGMNSKLAVKVYVPVNGLPLPAWRGFCPGQPDDAGGKEKCVEVTYMAIIGSCLNDLPCSASKADSIICEKNA